MSRISAIEHDLLRTYPQASKLYLGVERGVTLLTARVDGTHAEGDTTILLKDVVCDDFGELQKGMTVALHSIVGNDRRVDAVFLSYNQGTQILTIGPNARQADDDFYVTIFSAFKLWRLEEPTWDGAQHYYPIPCIGPHRAGFVDQQIAFVGENSYHPLGRTLNTPRWHVFQDGIVVGGDTSEFNTVDDPLLVTYPTAGEKLIRFRCDDSEGERAKTFRTVLMYDRTGENAPYSEVKVNNCRWNGTGWSLDITCSGVADTEQFPPQAMIVLFAEDWYGGLKRSVGGCLRGMGEIIFNGWIRSGTTVVNYEEKTVTFKADSVEAIAESITLPSFTFRDGLDTTNWHTFNGLDVTKAALHILQEHTTLGFMADMFFATFDYELDILDVPEDFLYNQLAQSVLQACFGFVYGSRFGSLTLGRHRNVINPTQRGLLNLPSIVFEPEDWQSLQIMDTKFADTGQVRLEGKLGDDTPIASNYPVSGPGHNGAIVTLTGLLFKDQAQADDLAERIYKRDNRGIKGVSLRLANYRVVEPAFEEYFNVYLPSAYNNRGLHWVAEENGVSGREFYTTEMAIEFGDGSINVMLAGELSRFGPNREDWTPADPAPTLQQVYGYDQNITGDIFLESLTDSEGVPLFDSEGVELLE